MSNKIELSINGKKVEVFNSSIHKNQWEPFVIEGEKIGEVSLLRQTEEKQGALTTGLWRHQPDEHPDGMPYAVMGAETFYVLEGEAELLTSNGDKVSLQSGNIYSFSNGFEGTWKTVKPFVKFFVES